MSKDDFVSRLCPPMLDADWLCATFGLDLGDLGEYATDWWCIAEEDQQAIALGAKPGDLVIVVRGDFAKSDARAWTYSNYIGRYDLPDGRRCYCFRRNQP